MEEFIVWIANNFHKEEYMLYTKIQGILWSIGDIIIVFFFLKIANLTKKTTEKKNKKRFIFLWISAILTPFLILANEPDTFLLLEVVICGIQFVILIYTVICERNDFMDLLKTKVMGR